MTSNQKDRYITEKIMIYFTSFIFVLFLISRIVLVLSLVLAKKVKFNREKASPFECGFDPNSEARLPFSLRFFLVSVIFLIFDVEIALLLPSVVALRRSLHFTWFLTTSVFLIILLLGLIHE